MNSSTRFRAGGDYLSPVERSGQRQSRRLSRAAIGIAAPSLDFNRPIALGAVHRHDSSTLTRSRCGFASIRASKEDARDAPRHHDSSVARRPRRARPSRAR
ncbi:MAG: hypothetical protein WCD76_06325 [Pyrinomonadaceae bacterium]